MGRELAVFKLGPGRQTSGQSMVLSEGKLLQSLGQSMVLSEGKLLQSLFSG